MNRKPMLAVDCGGVENLRFPLVISPKLDGVRALTTETGMYSRALKLIPNVNAQHLFRDLPFNLDGELLAGSPTAPDVYRKTVSMVMSADKPVDGLLYHVFDVQTDAPWEERYEQLCSLADTWTCWRGAVCIVAQVTVNSLAELLEYEARWVGQGYEGLMARTPGSPYKHGRSTVREGYIVKVKRFTDGEAEVIGVTELMHNANEAKTNELGRTARSHKKAGMMPTGTMGTLVVRDTKTGVEFEIGTGFTADERLKLWLTQSAVKLGEYGLVKYKHFPSGAKDKPRHSVFLGWRSDIDL